MTLPAIEEKLYCYNHPNRETTLRCNRCERPICTSCAVLTPTGYRCKECIKGQQKVFETAQWVDYPLGMISAGVLSFLGSLVVAAISGLIFWGYFSLLISPAVGAVIANVVRRVTRRRRSRHLFTLVAVATALGALPLLLINLLGTLLRITNDPLSSGFAILPLVWQGAYVILVTTTVYYRLRGIRVKT